MKDNDGFSVKVDVLKTMVNKWMQREHGSDDLDYYEEQGGEEWLEKGLKTDFKNGISSETILERERHFGSNRKEKIKPKSFF